MTSSTSTIQNPYYRVNLWSRLFHGWISSLLSKSHKQEALHLNDLFDLLPQLESNDLVGRLESNWSDELKQTNRQPSLLRATIRTAGWKPVLLGLVLIPAVDEISLDKSSFHSNPFLVHQELGKFFQPLLLTFLMGFFESCSPIKAWQAWLLVAGISLLSLSNSTFYHQV